MSKVELQSPENAQTGVSGNGPLIWNAVEGYDRYRVEVALRDTELTAGEEFDVHGALIDRIVEETSLTIDPPLSLDTQYVWRVRAARVEIEEPEPAVLNVTVNPSVLSIEEGSTASVSATVQVEGGASQEVTWEISNTDTAAIESTGPTTATVSGVLAGTETITATSVADETKTGTALLTVTEVPVYEGGTQGDIDFLKAMYTTQGGGDWAPAIQAGWTAFMAGNTLPASDGTQLGGIKTAMRNGEMRIVEIRMNTLKESSSQGQDGGGLINAELVNGQWELIPGREFPDVGNLTECERFDIKGNTLRGPVPPNMWKMVKCKKVLLAGHPRDPQLSGQQHPTSSSSGKQTRDNNYWEGTLTNAGLINMQAMEFFECMYHGISGPLPKDFGNLPNLGFLHISAHEIFENTDGGWTGTVPAEWGNSTSIKYLAVGNSSLTGPLPHMASIEHGRLSANQFDGGIPPEWANTPNWRMLYVPDNAKLGGSFPDFIFTGESVGDTTKNRLLNVFHIANCGITGTVGPNVNPALFSHLNVFRLQRNKLSGQIPAWFAGLRLIQFDISGQIGTGMNGPLPAEFDNPNAGIWSRIRTWRANGNPIGGNLPKGGFGPDILEARLGGCGFTGAIPEAWGPQTTTGRYWDLQINNNNLTSYEIGSDGRGCIKPLVMSGSSYVSGWRTIEHFRAQGNALDQASVNQIIIDMDANVQSRVGTQWFRTGTLRLNGGTNASPSNTSTVNNAIARLESNGWTVSRN